MTQHLVLKYALYLAPENTSEDLLKAVNMELKLVSKDFHKLPGVAAFNCVTDGAIATFTRNHGNEEIAVTLDVMSAVPVESMSDDFDAAEQDVSLTFTKFY